MGVYETLGVGGFEKWEVDVSREGGAHMFGFHSDEGNESEDRTDSPPYS